MPLILTIIAIVFLYQVIFNFKRIMKKLNDHDLKQIRKIEEVSEEEVSEEEPEEVLKELRKDVKEIIDEGKQIMEDLKEIEVSFADASSSVEEIKKELKERVK